MCLLVNEVLKVGWSQRQALLQSVSQGGSTSHDGCAHVRVMLLHACSIRYYILYL